MDLPESGFILSQNQGVGCQMVSGTFLVSHLRQARGFRELVESFLRQVRARLTARIVGELVGVGEEPVRRQKGHGEASPAHF